MALLAIRYPGRAHQVLERSTYLVLAMPSLIAFAFFVAHTFTAIGTSFFDRRLLKDANFVTGLLFAFIVGMVLYATMALLPTLLQGLLGYPVVYTGMVMAPRGVGSLISMKGESSKLSSRCTRCGG